MPLKGERKKQYDREYLRCLGVRERKKNNSVKYLGRHCGTQDFKEYRALCTRRHNDRLRAEVLAAYGGPDLKCVCECGCSERCTVMLDLDHVNNDAQDHYREAGGRGSKFFKWLRKNGFPMNRPLRVLCCNCNVGRQRNAGICPRIRIVPIMERVRPQKRLHNCPLRPGEIAADMAGRECLLERTECP